MSDIDHKQEAEAILFGDIRGRDIRGLMEATVSATLYLAEQQRATAEQLRVANLIAIAGWAEVDGVHEEFAEEALDSMTDTVPRKVLGLS